MKVSFIPCSFGPKDRDPSHFPCSQDSVGVGHIETVKPTLSASAGRFVPLALTQPSTDNLLLASTTTSCALASKKRSPIAPGAFLPRPIVSLLPGLFHLSSRPSSHPPDLFACIPECRRLLPAHWRLQCVFSNCHMPRSFDPSFFNRIFRDPSVPRRFGLQCGWSGCRGPHFTCGVGGTFLASLRNFGTPSTELLQHCSSPDVTRLISLYTSHSHVVQSNQNQFRHFQNNFSLQKNMAVPQVRFSLSSNLGGFPVTHLTDVDLILHPASCVFFAEIFVHYDVALMHLITHLLELLSIVSSYILAHKSTAIAEPSSHNHENLLWIFWILFSRSFSSFYWPFPFAHCNASFSTFLDAADALPSQHAPSLANQSADTFPSMTNFYDEPCHGHPEWRHFRSCPVPWHLDSCFKSSEVPMHYLGLSIVIQLHTQPHTSFGWDISQRANDRSVISESHGRFHLLKFSNSHFRVINKLLLHFFILQDEAQALALPYPFPLRCSSLHFPRCQPHQESLSHSSTIIGAGLPCFSVPASWWQPFHIFPPVQKMSRFLLFVQAPSTMSFLATLTCLAIHFWLVSPFNSTFNGSAQIPSFNSSPMSGSPLLSSDAFPTC